MSIISEIEDIMVNILWLERVEIIRRIINSSLDRPKNIRKEIYNINNSLLQLRETLNINLNHQLTKVTNNNKEH